MPPWQVEQEVSGYWWQRWLYRRAELGKLTNKGKRKGRKWQM